MYRDYVVNYAQACIINVIQIMKHNTNIHIIIHNNVK